jgi:hypothetical protein
MQDETETKADIEIHVFGGAPVEASGPRAERIATGLMIETSCDPRPEPK